jgi:hypothetical protein
MGCWKSLSASACSAAMVAISLRVVAHGEAGHSHTLRARGRLQLAWVVCALQCCLHWFAARVGSLPERSHTMGATRCARAHQIVCGKPKHLWVC